MGSAGMMGKSSGDGKCAVIGAKIVVSIMNISVFPNIETKKGSNIRKI